jgi:hypothetical protein
MVSISNVQKGYSPSLIFFQPDQYIDEDRKQLAQYLAAADSRADGRISLQAITKRIKEKLKGWNLEEGRFYHSAYDSSRQRYAAMICEFGSLFDFDANTTEELALAVLQSIKKANNISECDDSQAKTVSQEECVFALGVHNWQGKGKTKVRSQSGPALLENL